MPDQLSSPFGLDSAQPIIKLADVRAQPPKQDQGYDTEETDGDLPNMTAIIYALLQHRELITRNQMIYLIVDNRKPEAVPHWPAFATWWASRRCLVGPQEEATDVLWVCADRTTGLHKVPYYWAGVFVLEAARFLYPKQHFALIDNDCVPVTLFEVQDLIELAHQQLQWVDLIGHARAESDTCRGIGMLLFGVQCRAGHFDRQQSQKQPAWRVSLLQPRWPMNSTRTALHWSLELGHRSPRVKRRLMGPCLLPLLGSQCKVPSTCVSCGHCMGYTCARTFGLAPNWTLPHMQKRDPSNGLANPTLKLSLRGSPAGLEPPSSRESCQRSPC